MSPSARCGHRHEGSRLEPRPSLAHTAQTTRMAVLFQLCLSRAGQRMGCAMFDLDQFIADCRAALAADTSHKNVREVVARAVSDPAAILDGLGEPKRSEVQKLYHSSELTILNVIWAPHMTIMPHNHQMWAVIGIYTGREDNIFWRRVPGAHGGKLEAVGARALSTKDADPLGHNTIHSVTNPIVRLTGAIHVYGGDFFGAERSEWDPETLEEGRYDAAKTMRMFEEANARYGAS
jgi:predicted metal-dependent enzyme (double-stranded beta helix superfamily)